MLLFRRQRRRLGSLFFCSGATADDELSHLREVLHDLDVSSSVFVDRTTWTRLLQVCSKHNALEEGRRLHQHIRRLELDRSSALGVPVLAMFSKLRSVEDARSVFDRLTERNVVAWTVMIGAYAQNGYTRPALGLLRRMQLEGVRPNDITFINALLSCSSPAELPDGFLIHSLIDESQLGDSELCVRNTLVSMYGKCGSLEDAMQTFRSMNLRDSLSWSIVIAACSRYEDCEDLVLSLFREMQLEGFSPQNPTLGIVLHACARLDALQQGTLIHQSLVQSGITLNSSVGIALLNLYGKCGSLNQACETFDGLEEPNVVSWNSMMTVFIQRGCANRAVTLFHAMHREGVRPSKVTYVTVLNACSNRSFLPAGKLIHASLAESGYEVDVSVANALINMYDACESLRDAEATFSRIKNRNSITWNVMISAYIQHNNVGKANKLFREMMQELGRSDRATLVIVLNACTSIAEVDVLHRYIHERGDESHGILGSALVNMHGRYGTLEEARRIFEQLQYKDIISWNGMIGACGRTGNPLQAWELYQKMTEDIKPNTITYVAVLEACTSMVALDKGRQVHSSVPEALLKTSAEIGTSLINFYGKCGKVAEAKKVFDGLGKKDVVLWSALITAFSQLGYWEEALFLVKAMQHEGVEPNHITYVSVISACSHAGLVEDAYDYFLEMSRGYGIQPTSEHYRCIVDLLARAGQLDEAERVLTRVKDIGPLAWMSLLAACKSQGDVQRARRAAKLAIMFNPESSAGYVALCNTFVQETEELIRSREELELRTSC